MKKSLNKILIAEDDVLISEHLKQILTDLGHVVYDIVSSYEMAKKSIDINDLPDLALLDIRMHNEDQGIKIAEYIKKLNIPFIFITSFSDKKTLEEAIFHQPKGYLLKPFTPDEIKKIIDKVMKELAISYLFVKEKDKKIKLFFNKIMFVKSDNNYLEIHTETKMFVERLKLIDIDNILPKDSFIRVHRSYLVNKKFIERINNNSIVINGVEIPVSRKYKNCLDSL
ncbi:response regulator transcription factor [Vicingus serpentipes]|uniref:Response regulator transcription factor n=1 Tax=Vicingus serpentipes TaxID=1926625 RepID=A0A5C6RXB7_9FLAO|nr:response regulator transcription factor [Vicingus serpentipes]TXB66998.1 response regulator transcription factor [Vicingus serpentipes]